MPFSAGDLFTKAINKSIEKISPDLSGVEKILCAVCGELFTPQLSAHRKGEMIGNFRVSKNSEGIFEAQPHCVFDRDQVLQDADYRGATIVFYEEAAAKKLADVMNRH